MYNYLHKLIAIEQLLLLLLLLLRRRRLHINVRLVLKRLVCGRGDPVVEVIKDLTEGALHAPASAETNGDNLIMMRARLNKGPHVLHL